MVNYKTMGDLKVAWVMSVCAATFSEMICYKEITKIYEIVVILYAFAFSLVTLLVVGLETCGLVQMKADLKARAAMLCK